MDIKITEEGKKRLGKALKEFREFKRWSLRQASDEIAKRADGETIAFTTLGDIEAGKRDIRLETLLLLSATGYGELSLTKMIDLLRGRQMVLAEKGSKYVAGN